MNVLEIILISLIIGLSMTLWYYHETNSINLDRIKAYQSQLTQLKIQYEESQRRYEMAHTQMTEDMRRLQEASKEIENTKVPPGCDAALEFGKQKAKEFTLIIK